MVNEFKLIDESTGNVSHFDTRSDAQERKQDIQGLTEGPLKIEHVDGKTDGGEKELYQPGKAEPVETIEGNGSEDALAELGEELGTDPLSILPSHMVDTIQGQPAVNKRGYAMIAERYGIEVSSDVIQFPWDNEENRCVAKATAITQDGKQYSGWATASADGGDMEEQLIELAETRSLKRAVSWASGVGIVSYQELAGELE